MRSFFKKLWTAGKFMTQAIINQACRENHSLMTSDATRLLCTNLFVLRISSSIHSIESSLDSFDCLAFPTKETRT